MAVLGTSKGLNNETEGNQKVFATAEEKYISKVACRSTCSGWMTSQTFNVSFKLHNTKIGRHILTKIWARANYREPPLVDWTVYFFINKIYLSLLLSVSKQQNTKGKWEPLDEEQATTEPKKAAQPVHAFCLTVKVDMGYILYKNVSEQHLQSFSILRTCST